MGEHPVILFDGICNFCNAGVNYLIRQDRKKRFRFAPLQSIAGLELLQQYRLHTSRLDSFVFIDEGKAFQKSTAALKIMKQLPWYWQWTRIFWLLPRSLRDPVYDLIAKNRYQWFGKKDHCMVPTPELRSRFL